MNVWSAHCCPRRIAASLLPRCLLTGAGGAASWRGAIYYQTESERLERLNGVAGVFEFEVDQEGNTRGKVWEWK